MKRLRMGLCVFAAVFSLLSTGCSNNGGDPDDISGGVPISAVRNSFLEDSQSLRNQSFGNINFANTLFSFPETDKFYSLEYKLTDYNISPDDAYNYMCKRLDELFPGMFGDEEKANEIRFYDVGDVKEYPTLEQYKAMEDRHYPHTASDHPTTSINSDLDKFGGCDLLIRNGVLSTYDNGYLSELKDLIELPRPTSDILERFPVIYRTEDLGCEKVFHLSSGDISISDAVGSAEKLISQLELSERELPFRICIQNVNVLDIGNGCCAFYFGIVPEYKGIELNCMLPDGSAYGYATIVDSTHEIDMCSEAIMCEADKICRFRQVTPFASYDIAENGSETSIVPLKDAAKTVSEYMTAGMNFDVLSVSAVYKPFSEKDVFDYEKREDYERRTRAIKPCWRFVLQPLTGNTDRLYYIFVDMATGVPYETVQQTSSGIKYDVSGE